MANNFISKMRVFNNKLEDLSNYRICGKTVGAILAQFFTALVVRLLFTIHGIVTIWKVADACDNNLFYLLYLPLGFLWVEMVITNVFNETGEWKWLCPSVLLYFTSVIPGIWLLQLQLYETREEYRQENDLEKCVEITTGNLSGLPDVGGVSIPIEISLGENQWASALQQIMFVLLIVCRWLLPKGHLTRDQLSQLLLVYLSIAADSLEFSLETLSLPDVFCNPVLITAVLSIWTWSLVQFFLVQTSVSARKARGIVKGGNVVTKSFVRRYCEVVRGCCGNLEIWSLLITVLLQDAPFLIMRLFLMIKFKVLSELMLVFVVKNILVVGVQIYRVVILCYPQDDQSLNETQDYNDRADVEKTVDSEQNVKKEINIQIEGNTSIHVEEASN